MGRNKKGQGRTFWIVVTAVVALVVLVILLMIFTGKVGMLETGLMSCEGKGGICVTREICPEGTSKSTVFSCPEEKFCCISAKKRVGGACETNADCLSGQCHSVDKKCIGEDPT